MSTIENQALVRVKGSSLPFCSSYKVTFTDTDLDSGRNIKAKMIRNRVRSNMYKLEFSYNLLSAESVKEIIELTSDEFFTVEFYSPLELKRITKTMYVGDRTFSWVTVRGDNGEYILKCQDLSFNFIEQ